MSAEPTVDERRLLDAIEPYVLLSASTLITATFQQNHSSFALLSRPNVFRATVRGGRVEFEVPEWLPVEEALLSAANCGLHSIVKHLPLRRVARPGAPGMRLHMFEIAAELCRDGQSVSLSYFAWFRFAAPPYHFEAENQVAAYVGAALGHLGRAQGLRVRSELAPALSMLWLSDRLRIEVVGAAELTEMAILLDDDETSLSFAAPQLSVARRMFPDVYAAVRSAAEAGEHFRGAALLVEEDQVLLYDNGDASHVSA